MGIVNIISLFGGIALFLYGVMLMGNGLNMVAGDKLELVLYRLTNSPLKGIALGTGVTALIQSSSATSVMVVGFVNSGMMQFGQAVPIILGSILGTSITAWIICLSELGGGGGWVQLLSASAITGILAVVGIYFRKFTKQQTKQHIGDIFLGFAILMFGMSTMSGAMAPLKESAAFISFLTKFSNPALGILLGALFACLVQSSAAAVGVLQALALTGALSFAVAYPILLGIAIGGAIPVLLSALGANISGQRTALTHLLIDVFGAVICGIIFYVINAVHPLALMGRTMTMVSVAAANTLFRLAVVILLLPFTRCVEHLACALIKDRSAATSAVRDLDCLEERFLQHPALAIEQSRSVVNSMALHAKQNLAEATAALAAYSDAAFAQVEETETLVDQYEDKLGSYLVKLCSKELSKKQNGELYKCLHAITDLERISDHALNIAECAKEIHEKQICFSDDAQQELAVLQGAVNKIISISVEAFIENDLERAVMVEPLEELIDNLCDEIKSHHVDRLQHGSCTLQNGFVFNDLLTNYERIGDHCSNIAVAMIELDNNVFDTHQYLNNLDKKKNDAFTAYFEEFSAEFHLDF